MKRAIITAAFMTPLLLIGTVRAQHEHGSMGMDKGEHQMMSHEQAQLHGGTATMTKAHHFEVVYMPDGIRVYAYDGKQHPIAAKGITGEVTLMRKDGEPETLELKHQPGAPLGEDEDAEHMHDYLFAPIDLSSAKAESFRARFELKGMSGENEPETQFISTYGGLTKADYVCPMHPDAWGATADSKCPLCGMKTTKARHMPMHDKKSDDAEHSGHDHR